MTRILTPVERIAQAVTARYVNHPDVLASLLHRMGGQNVRVEGHQVRSTCPVHMGSNSDAFVVWFDRGVPIWRCYTDCADRGLLPRLVMRKYKCTFEQAVGWLAQCVGMQVDLNGYIEVSPEQLDEEATQAFRRQLGLDKVDDQPTFFPESMVQFSMQRKPELFLRRGYSQQLLDYFQVGVVPGGVWTWPDPKDSTRQQGWFQDRISIPWRLHQDGRLIGFAGRRLDDDPHRKYLNLPGLKKVTLYGLSDPHIWHAVVSTRELVLLEGYPDVWRGFGLGIYPIVAVGGTELGPKQISLIAQLNLKRVVTYFDGDDAGQLTAARMGQQLMEVVPVFNAVPPMGKDPGDLMTVNEFWEPVSQATRLLPN